MNDNQITVTLTNPLSDRERDAIIEGILPARVQKVLVAQLRSALKAEQKPVEPKTVTLGPDTPLGWYRVIDCKEKHHGNGACELQGEPLQLYKVDKSGGWFYRGSLVDIGATLLPVAPPVAEDDNKKGEGEAYVSLAITFIRDEIETTKSDWLTAAEKLAILFGKRYSEGRASVLREINEKIGEKP